jgi:phytoene dehydrogenase-like protein
MAALTAGARVRVVDRRSPVGGRVGEVIAWRGVAFHVELDGLGAHLIEPEELERVRD